MKSTQTTPTVILTLKSIVSREKKSAPSSDERRRLNRVVASYFGSDGHEYRKSFESYDEPVVPTRGINREITKLQKQW